MEINILPCIRSMKVPGQNDLGREKLVMLKTMEEAGREMLALRAPQTAVTTGSPLAPRSSRPLFPLRDYWLTLFRMKKKECPSCAMEIDASSKVCPVCSYEFAQHGTSLRWVAILLVVIFLVYILAAVFN